MYIFVLKYSCPSLSKSQPFVQVIELRTDFKFIVNSPQRVQGEFMASQVRKPSFTQIHNWPERVGSVLTRHGEFRASSWRAVPESTRFHISTTRLSVCRASTRRVKSESTKLENCTARHSVHILATTCTYSPQRVKAVSDSLMTWQKPTDKAMSTRHSVL
jgi:hypothetical protein